jgi:nitroreductase
MTETGAARAGEAVDRAVRERRTHKVYEREPAAPEVVRELLELAGWAPNHHLTQPWRFRVLGPGSFARLEAAAGPSEALKLRRAPTLVVASVRAGGDDELAELEDLCAAACACYIVLLAAHARGLASYWRTSPALLDPAGRAAVGIPDDERVIGLLHLGRPARTPQPPERPPAADAIVFLD